MAAAVDHANHGAVLAGDVDQAIGPQLQRMRCNVRPQINVADMRAPLQVEDAHEMVRIGIAAVNAIAEDRHVGKPGLRHHQQFVHGARKAVEHDFGLVGDRIEEENLSPHLVDGDHATCAACVGHRACFPFRSPRWAD